MVWRQRLLRDRGLLEVLPTNETDKTICPDAINSQDITAAASALASVHGSEKA